MPADYCLNVPGAGLGGPPEDTEIDMIFSRHLRLALVAAVLSSPFAAAAEPGDRHLGVVELFTSQGCSSCPPADANLAAFAERDDVVALAYHVDYWDYLGWRDTLASPENTRRQRDYATALGQRSVYTPQAVVNGRMHLNGADKDGIERKLAATATDSTMVDVTIEDRGDSMVIEADADGDFQGKAKLVLVFFVGSKVVEIARGENTGKRLLYRNSVTGVQTAGMWHGNYVRVEIPFGEMERHGATGCAVLVQTIRADGNPGPIIGSAVLERPGS